MRVKQITVHLFHLLDGDTPVGWLRRHFDGPKSWWVAHRMNDGTEWGENEYATALDRLIDMCGHAPVTQDRRETEATRFSYLEVD